MFFLGVYCLRDEILTIYSRSRFIICRGYDFLYRGCWVVFELFIGIYVLGFLRFSEVLVFVLD